MPRSAARHRRTNVVLDMALVERAKAKLHVSTTREAIDAALKQLVEKPDYSALIEAYGSGGIHELYEPKAAYGKRDEQP